MRIIIEVGGLLVALIGAEIMRHLLYVNVVGAKLSIDFIFAQVTIDPLVSTFIVFFFIYETAYRTGRFISEKQI
jgi:hypothetical protein